MKKSGKRLLSLLMTAAMLLSLLPAMTGGAAAAGAATIDLTALADMSAWTAEAGYGVVKDASGTKAVQISGGGPYTITGSATTNIIVTGNAELILSGATIQAGAYKQTSPFDGKSNVGTAAISIQNNAVCTLTLADGTTNTLTGIAGNGSSGKLLNTAAISVDNYVSQNGTSLATLVIRGATGILNATGTNCAAAIGGNHNRLAGNITIEGGVINATSGEWAAAIGDGDTLNQENNNNPVDNKNWACTAVGATQTCQQATIKITGGTVHATAKKATPGIGTSDELSTAQSGRKGVAWDGLLIEIDGGTVIAVGGAANQGKPTTGIGAGSDTTLNPANITINQSGSTKLVAVSVAPSYAIVNDGTAAYPSINSSSTANVLNLRLTTARKANLINFWELVNGTYSKITGFPNDELAKLQDTESAYGIATVVPTGTYKVYYGDTPLSDTPIVVDGSGMVTAKENGSGLDLCYPITLTKPENKSVTVGDSATFSVTATTHAGSSSTYSYQWQSSTDGKNWSNVSGATANTYTVSSAALAQSGTQYRCCVVDTTSQLTATSAAATLTVSEKNIPVTITGVTVAGKTYDGTAVAYTGTPTAADGSGQTASIDSYTYQWQKSDGTVLTDAPKDAGSYKLVVSVPSNNAGYSGSTSIPFTISPKPVTITGLTANNKIYDGGLSAVPAGTAAIDGRVGNDDLTVTAGTAAFADKNVGTGKAVSFSGYALGGTAAGNYTLSAQPAGTTADITAKPVTVSGISASDKAYDGKTDATLTYGSVTITGKDSGDTVTVSAAGAFANADAGQGKTVNISGITLGGADAGNYKLAESGQQATTTANITAAAVTLTGVTVPGKIYDGKAVVPNTSALTVSGGTVDTATLVYTYYKNTGTSETPAWTKLDAAPKDAGTYKLVVSVPGSNADYSGSTEIPFTVAPAPVTITVANKNVLVGNAAPSLANPVAGTDYTVTGLVGSDTLTTAPTLAYSPAPDLSKAGSCAITASGASAGGNYAITSVDGTLTVTAAAPKNYTVSFDPNGGTLAAGTAAQTVTENLKLTRPADPTREGYTFLGWYRDKSGTTAWDFDTAGVTGAATLYAKWAQKTYSVSGSVTDSGNNAVSDAVVTVVQGTKEFMRTATGSDGSYTFTGVAPGVYNVVAVKGGVTKTILVTITNGDMGDQNIQMPAGKVNSVLEVTGSDTPNVVVGGLEKQADKVKEDHLAATDVLVKMTVEEKPENAVTANDVTAIKKEAAKTTANTNLEYIDIAVKQTVTETKDGKTESQVNSDIHETNAILEIVIPYDTTGKTDITVYRNHTADSEGATTFGKLASRHEEEAGRRDKTFYVDTANNRIYVYAQKFSTYAISYKTADAGTGTGTGGSASAGGSGSTGSTGAAASVAVADTAGGAVSVSTVQPAPGSTVTITVKPETGRQISTVTVTDESGKSVAVTQNSDGTYTYTQPAGKVSVKAVFRTIPADPSATGVSKLLQTADHIVYLHGYPDASFGPERSMTRAEAAQMFYNLLLNREAGGTAGFTDVSADAWYKTAVDTLASLKIIEGVGGNTFAPERAVTRAEFTAMAMRFAALTTGGTNAFSDVSKTDWFYDEVVGSEKYGWITGYSDGSFKPNATISRAEVTTIVNRMLGRSADTAFVDANAARLRTFPDTASSYWAYYDIAEATNAHEYTKTNGTESWKS